MRLCQCGVGNLHTRELVLKPYHIGDIPVERDGFDWNEPVEVDG
jgi:hypothetical protein